MAPSHSSSGAPAGSPLSSEVPPPNLGGALPVDPAKLHDSSIRSIKKGVKQPQMFHTITSGQVGVSARWGGVWSAVQRLVLRRSNDIFQGLSVDRGYQAERGRPRSTVDSTVC